MHRVVLPFPEDVADLVASFRVDSYPQLLRCACCDETLLFLDSSNQFKQHTLYFRIKERFFCGACKTKKADRLAPAKSQEAKSEPFPK